MVNVPTRFSNSSLLDWPETHAIRKLIDNYLTGFNDFYTQGKAPMFVGTAGSGKSRAAAAVLNAIDKGSSVELSTGWFSASESLNLLLDSKDLHMRDSYTNIFSAIRNTDIIVLDDISTIRGYPRLQEYFWIVLEHRYNEMKPTIFTANFEIHTGVSFWDTLEEWFSPAIARRLKELSSGLTLLL